MDSDKKRVYKKNFLTNVIFRVDFPITLELKNIDEFQNKIRDSFPVSNELKGGLVTYGPKTDEFSFKTETSWEFQNKDKTKKVSANPAFLSLECFRYEHFDNFHKDIKSVFMPFLELFPTIKTVKRIGLRYINQIKLDEGNPFDWSNLINNDLFSVPAKFISDKDKDDLLKSMQLLEVKEDDNLLKFQFGFFNSEHPNPIARREFVLDYDCVLNDEIDISEIYNKSRSFNKIIEGWFEKSILDGLRTIMGDRDDK